MAVRFIQKVCSSSLLELQSEESLLYLPPSKFHLDWIQMGYQHVCILGKKAAVSVFKLYHVFSDLNKNFLSITAS